MGRRLHEVLIGCVGLMCVHAWAWPGVVTHVSDGDTVWVQSLRTQQTVKVRLLGLDAPEICQAWGPQSQHALTRLLQGQVVEVKARAHDAYGRLLAQVFREGHDVGAWMVGQGYAWSDSYRGRAGLYSAEQANAQRLHLGLFADAQAVPPRWFRKRVGACHVP